MKTDYLVIGSGPAAVAAAKAIIANGNRVTILDVGTRLEADRQKVVDRMAAQSPSEWSDADVESVSSRCTNSGTPIHTKTSYGSAFSFDRRDNALDIRWSNGHGFRHSLAMGGLSNVWGSAMLPYREADIRDWPIRISDLEPHYRAVTGFVPCTTNADALEEILPSYSVQDNSIRLSAQGSSLLQDLDASAKLLRRSGIIHGKARLAIRASDKDVHHCRYCTLCLSGCPYALVYSSTQTLKSMMDEGSADYLSDHLVEKLVMVDGRVMVSGKNLGDDSAFSILAKRVFLGTGVLSTASIIMFSLGLYDKPLTLLDSQYFIYPLLRLRAATDVQQENMHTASQVFLELDNPAISEGLVHFQVYGYSSFLHRELDRTFLRWPLKSTRFRHHFLGRLMIAQGFIHSSDSGIIRLTLRKSENGSNYLHARTHRGHKTITKVLKIGITLLRNALRMRTMILLPGLQLPKPGSGYHSGGTFPMRANPGHLETDTLGSLPSLPGVHIVDSSVLPSIPATSITMSVMANSHRIADAACKLDL